jgi:hypothetical protein
MVDCGTKGLMAVRVPVCSWYMSVDFELFLLLPLYAVAFAYNRILGYTIPALLWAASIIYSWQVGVGTSGGSHQLDVSEVMKKLLCSTPSSLNL